MTQPSKRKEQPSMTPVRIVSAAALFDGHDASINIMRRILQSLGAEVIHLGHDRSVDDVATAAIQEDADAIAVSSYQGGHVEFFTYLIDRLREEGAEHIRIYGGGGGVISPEEVASLEAYGVTRIFRPEDGARLGLQGMIHQIVDPGSSRPPIDCEKEIARLSVETPTACARLISFFEERAEGDTAKLDTLRQTLEGKRSKAKAPVVGFTGTGGAGKSSLLDELIRRLRLRFPERSIGILTIDPTRRRSGGALLGDRLRMNALQPPQVFLRSLATRRAHLALSTAVADGIRVLQAAGFDLIFVETAGIGQSDSEIIDLVDLSTYVMTPEYGAPSQLEKIDMIDLADLVVLNKFDRRGAQDALHDVRKQWRRNHDGGGALADDELPVFATIASRWNDPGTDALCAGLVERLAKRGFEMGSRDHASSHHVTPESRPLIPENRTRYLAEIAETVRGYRNRAGEQAKAARTVEAMAQALEILGSPPPGRAEPFPRAKLCEGSEELCSLRGHYNEALEQLTPEVCAQLADWPSIRDRYRAKTQSYAIRGREIPVENHVESLAGNPIPRVCVPDGESFGELTRYLCLENLPGHFPFTAGVFPFKRTDEEETARMFAGEGPPERTNRRFHLLAHGQPAVRLSTAFDSVTLYGRDPDERPDIYGKVGTSGVSVCTVNGAKKLYSGFDLLDPKTSVSMTINGPAPILLAFYFNAVIDQAVEKHLIETGQLERVRAELKARGINTHYDGDLPEGHNGLGLGLLGVSGDEVVDAETYAHLRAEALRKVRGTVQADILKEDQAQNTCIFSTEFSLKLMGDIQEFFIRENVRNFYSVSVSGYHIAEAGANPISQLAFTLANGFTYCEYYLGRGMQVDEFAPSFSFFFSNGLDPEYAAIGRVARRIWAVAMRERYGANKRSQKLKYHVQTSGRSLHAQEMDFNDIRTTLQALVALQDHCNSLHTNAYDEAFTTPTEDSVRRALAIQLVLNREFGVFKNENSAQGSYFVDQLTDLVEDAILSEFERISARGGVLGAMETMYQRSRIQDESMKYEEKKHSGELPIVGVNTFVKPGTENDPQAPTELIRASEEEKDAQLANLRTFQKRHASRAPEALRKLQKVAAGGGNVFDELLETVKVASLGQITDALFEVGGRYRRSM